MIQEENKVPSYTLPDLLMKSDGKRVESAAEWEKLLRSQTLQTFETEVYGQIPNQEVAVTYEENLLHAKTLKDFGSIREIRFSIEKDGNRIQAVLLLILPDRSSPVPVFLGYNFNGNHTIHPDESISLPESWVANSPEMGVRENRPSPNSRGKKSSRWAVQQILERGYGLATMYYGDIDPDFDDGFENGVHSLFSKNKTREKDDWGSIATWAWGLSRVMDYFETNPLIDKNKVCVLGHSRLGKAALFAGANDKRFALVISNNSGCGGAALSKRRFGETVAAINDRFPHWFCENFKKYNHNEDQLPVDQHQLLALMAPRPVYVASAAEDLWADPKGEFLAAKNASAVYRLYGLKGLQLQEMPEVNKPHIDGYIGYHIRSGVHDLTAYDWEQFLNFADARLK
ncbi:glucuronyl esterase domain-containing protein [Poritiphilus flavus]|uniref:glucuronyl esterase domain-containing protein n=1 Tax=Poritiphilus flavus TaxID=2697053 RepID=UPI00293BEA59|nr:acetylxylan esterase [Poritiphilus flavus]